MSTPSPTDDADYVNRPGIRLVNSARYTATIKHPFKKVTVCLGIYNTKTEAIQAYIRKELVYKSLSHHDSTDSSILTDIADFEHLMGVKCIRKGKWRAMVSQGKDKVYLGVYNSAKEAAEAYILSKLELECQKGNRSRKVDASRSEIMCDDGVAQNERDSVCKYDDFLVPTGDGSSEITVEEVEGDGKSMIGIMNRENGSRKELDLEIVDGNGDLVGEWSKMDDDLWFWRDEDDEDEAGW